MADVTTVREECEGRRFQASVLEYLVVIEHRQAVKAHTDWIIDPGPGAGHDGRRVVFEGTPADLVAARSTLTGEHVTAFVG